MVVVNVQRCPFGPRWRSWLGATTVGAYRAQDSAVHTCGSPCGGSHPGATAGSRLLPTGLRLLSLGRFEGKLASAVDCCRSTIAIWRCVFRPDSSLAARIGSCAMRSDRSHDSGSDRHPTSRRGISTPRRPRRRGDRDSAWSTDHVATPYGRRPRRQRSTDRRSRRRGSVPSCPAGFDCRAERICCRARESQGHSPASSSC